MHGLPLAYSKDLQEDKEALFDAVDNLELCLEAAEALLPGSLRFDRERLAEAAADEDSAATDIADLLGSAQEMPFREAHGVVGGLVPRRSSGARLSELTMRSLAATPSCSTTPTTRRCAPTAGWSRRFSRRDRVGAARRAARGRQGAPRRDPALSSGVLVSRRLEADFLDRSVHDVARDLIGCELLFDGVGGVIVECESYERDDPACHASA